MHRMLSILLFVVISFAFTQDRSTIFSTGNPPNLGEGWNIQCSEYASENNLGDINEDSSVDILDIVTIVNFIIEEIVLTDAEFLISDINVPFFLTLVKRLVRKETRFCDFLYFCCRLILWLDILLLQFAKKPN